MLPLNPLLLLDAGLFGGLIGTDVGNLEFFGFFFFFWFRGSKFKCLQGSDR